MNRNNKDGPRGKGVNENISRTVRISSKNTPEEVQRVIDKINQVPDNELHEFLDEDFMDGLDVVDAWEGEDDPGDDVHNRDYRDKDHRRNSRDHNRRDFRDSGRNNRDNRDRDRDRERGRRDDRRREERRDPSKSSQDIERDKIRAKRINESKILAEKEKAIKHLLDSGTVVPPGTEVETIENEKQMDRDRDREHDRERDRDREQRSHRSRDRRRSLDRHRLSPTRRKSHDRNRLSPLRRSPLVNNLRKSMDRHRRPSWEHPGSSERRDRRSSLDRGRRRLDERDVRIVGRRSRSRERQRSRSQDRYRRRWSRSSGGRRNSPRRRTHSKSPDHRRKRTPFIDELARQFRENPIIPPDSMNQGYMHPSLRGIQSQQQTSLLGPGPGLPQIPGPPQHFMPLQESLPSMNAGQPGGPPSYIPYDNLAPAGSSMSFDPLSMHSITQSDYTAGPVLYNQPNSVPIHTIQARPGFVPMSRSPQPVPAPTMDQSTLFHQQVSTQIQASPSPQPERMDPGLHLYSERSSSTYNEGLSSSRRDRLKTPEPPVISKSKVMFKYHTLNNVYFI